MYDIALRLSEAPSQYTLEALLDALAWHNAHWYLRRWGVGEMPPASAAAAGVRWEPDAPSLSAAFQDAPMVFSRGWASCGPIAAVSVGYARAVERLRGVAIEQSHDNHRVVLLSQNPGGRERLWHAYHLARHRLVDPTAAMRRV